MDSTCFACRPGPSTAKEPRWLCWEHKRTCELSDGALLYATLALAEPPDGPLEGSALGWLYSPVYVVDARGIRIRAWTSAPAERSTSHRTCGSGVARSRRDTTHSVAGPRPSRNSPPSSRA